MKRWFGENWFKACIVLAIFVAIFSVAILMNAYLMEKATWEAMAELDRKADEESKRTSCVRVAKENFGETVRVLCLASSDTSSESAACNDAVMSDIEGFARFTLAQAPNNPISRAFIKYEEEVENCDK